MSAVEEFLDSLDHPLRSEIDRLRAIIAKSGPALDEHIKWNAPSFMAEGTDCITLRLFPPKAVQVIFHRGARPDGTMDLKHLDGSGRLKWAAPDRAIATFANLADIDKNAEALSGFCAAWVTAISRTG